MDLKQSLKLYFIMGSTNCNCTRDPLWVLEEAILGGITLFQYREKGKGALTGEEKLRLGRKLQELCKKYQIPFIVDDDVDLMLELDADGIHIGQEDEDIETVKRRIGPDKIIGVSAYTLAEAKAAAESGAHYLGVGPVYPTATKEDAKEALGPAVIQHLRRHGIHIPIVGIGGIAPGKVKPVMEAGADGIAVISAISLAESPREAARTLWREINSRA